MQNYWWKKFNGRIESLYRNVRIIFHGTEDDVLFQKTYSDEQLQDAIDKIPAKHLKFIDYVVLSPEINGKQEDEYEFGRVHGGTGIIQIFKSVNLQDYGTNFDEQFAHEVAHIVARHIFGDEETNLEWEEISLTEHPVYKRARISAAEDFAESYSAYINGKLSQEDNPKRYKRLNKIIG